MGKVQTYAESIHLPILRMATHGITPKRRGMSPLRQPCNGADKTGIRKIRRHERDGARGLCQELAIYTQSIVLIDRCEKLV